MCSVFSGKRGRQCSERRADAAGRLDRAPLIPPPARACTGRPAGGVRHSAVSASSKVARNSLASFDENTSGERIFRICPSFPVALISTSRRPALMTFSGLLSEFVNIVGYDFYHPNTVFMDVT